MEAAPELLEAARGALPDAPAVEIATTAGVGRSAADASVEAMEGFGVLRAAALAGVPALELRASRTWSARRTGRAGTSPARWRSLGVAGATVLAALEELA